MKAGATQSEGQIAGSRRAARQPGNPVRRKSEITRERILDAAARHFRDAGYSGTRLCDIADSIGMKAGSLYYHFASREELVEAVMERGLRRTHEAVSGRLAGLPAGMGDHERIAVAIEAHLETVLAQGDTASATIKLFSQVPPDIRGRQLARQRAYGALWRRLLEEAQRSGAIRGDIDLSVVRMALMGALNWAADWYHPGRTGPRHVARTIASMILDGVARSRSGS